MTDIQDKAAFEKHILSQFDGPNRTTEGKAVLVTFEQIATGLHISTQYKSIIENWATQFAALQGLTVKVVWGSQIVAFVKPKAGVP